MINKNELRLNNIIQVPGWDRLNPDAECRFCVIGISRDDEEIELSNGVFKTSIKAEDIKPVPLTESALLRFGFNKDYKKGYIGIDVNNSDFVLTYPGVMGDFQKHFAFEYETGYLTRFHEIQSVHELQNLFRFITGKELEGKL